MTVCLRKRRILDPRRIRAVPSPFSDAECITDIASYGGDTLDPVALVELPGFEDVDERGYRAVAGLVQERFGGIEGLMLHLLPVGYK